MQQHDSREVIYNAQTLDSVIAGGLAARRITMILLGVFAGFAPALRAFQAFLRGCPGFKLTPAWTRSPKIRPACPKRIGTRPLMRANVGMAGIHSDPPLKRYAVYDEQSAW
ncbi:MAG TPA: hypothetical protein VEU96_30285 [Bryobacteraceae bacterium]|nr:hypothetical protein [Bryobacteraceae bacterium]